MVRSLSIGTALLFVLGCGLEDYDKRIDEQKAYLAKFDEESKALGEPLELPTKSFKDMQGNVVEEPAMKVEFFLRPPKGTQTTVKDKEAPFVFQHVSLFRYVGAAPGYNVLVGTNLVRDANDKEAKNDAVTFDEFQHQTRGALMEYYRHEFQRVVDWSTATKLERETVQVSNKGQTTNMTFGIQSLTDKPAGVTDPKDVAKFSIFQLYFYQQGKEQGAVVYQFPADKSSDGPTLQAVKISIKSFGLGADAAAKRQEYRKRKAG